MSSACVSVRQLVLKLGQICFCLYMCQLAGVMFWTSKLTQTGRAQYSLLLTLFLSLISSGSWLCYDFHLTLLLVILPRVFFVLCSVVIIEGTENHPVLAFSYEIHVPGREAVLPLRLTASFSRISLSLPYYSVYHTVSLSVFLGKNA